MQRDDGVCKVERAAVRQAHWMCDDIVAEAGAAIAVLRGEPDGYRRDERHLCPVGTVEFCREWMRLTGVAEPVPIDYPASLRDVLGRVVQCVPFADATIGAWIKPARTKAWLPQVKQSDRDHHPDELVWESAVIPESDWLAEWRVYVRDGAIIGCGRYDDRPVENIELDAKLVESWIQRWEATGRAPRGYALDVARWPRQTVLVEATDAWAIGLYKGTCRAEGYTRMLAARWGEIAKQVL
ncbi:hypothetical protein R77560_04440 [Ralstonia thomasii]|uniref:ATP-grasp domain-containing protein n=7 Tax=Pseudomonadota TaxID=1224 RepID=A0AAD2BU36_9RALS|nr:hypothetical protein R77560_04440 [Ralstonia sp. LMG 18095]